MLEESVAPPATIQGADSSKARIYRSLRADILGGAFDMGERLNEGVLAARYGVSKTPVREALTLLQQEGLVEVQPRVGYLTSRVTLQDVEDTFDLRLIVESAAAERAAALIDEPALNLLAGLRSTYQTGDQESYRRFLAENLAFHRIVAEATGNRRLVSVVVGLLETMQRLLLLRLDVATGGQDMVAEHGEILAALRAREGARARALMAQSIVDARQAVVTSLVRRMAGWHV
ncbi:MAG: GntR family transcriptional regulator [Chloroflexota bacterium]